MTIKPDYIGWKTAVARNSGKYAVSNRRGRSNKVCALFVDYKPVDDTNPAVMYNDGWNGSYHDCQYDLPFTVIYARNFKSLRAKIAITRLAPVEYSAKQDVARIYARLYKYQD